MTLRQADSVSPVEGVPVRRSAQKEFRQDIEGLRAVAVLAVVLFHADVPGVGGGYIGVDVFFVISGFLITGLLWREVSTAGTVRLRRFYGARARRLLPASAAVGVITLIGSAVLLPPLQARNVFGDGIASALYVGNYWFVLQAVDYFATNLPPSPFQHYWSLGVEEQFYLVWPALIIGTAWLIRRARRRTGADRQLVADSVSGGPRAGRGRVVCAVDGDHLRGAFRGVFFAAHPGLAVGRRRPGGPHGRPVAPTTGTTCRDRRMGRAGPDPVGLHPIGHGHALSRYRRAVARARRGAGDRRWLCLSFSGMRPPPGIVADAGGRPGVVLVVSVALAGAAARTAVAGPPAGAGRKVGSGPRIRRAGGAHPAFHREPVAIRRSAAPLCPRAASRSAVSPPRWRSVWAWRCW